jgi:trimethylamine:corrinoid methyltransferase-like protein
MSPSAPQSWQPASGCLRPDTLSPVSAGLHFTHFAPPPAGAKFVPTPEERLLSVVHALLHRCYKLPFSNAATV